MSVAAVMMVRDEGDIVGPTIQHLLTQVDHVYVADNRSVDATTDIIREFGEDRVSVTRDDVVAYNQSEKTTKLARWAASDGHGWVVPCDADEVWLAPDGHTLASFLSRQAFDVQVVSADLYDHIPTSLDPAGELIPQLRIGWRKDTPGVLPKVAVRTARDLVIHPGNHVATYGRSKFLTVPGLTLQHFTWRTRDQFLRKIRNGLEAYADVSRQDIGVHWRMFDGSSDDDIREHFDRWYFVDNPDDHTDLTYAPLTWTPGGFRT